MAASTTHGPASLTQSETALVVTLGGKPQLICFALDHLRRQGSPITRVIAVHFSTQDPRIKRSLDIVSQEFRKHQPYHGIRFENHVVRGVHLTSSQSIIQGHPIESSIDRTATDAIWMTWHRLISSLKLAETTIEMCLAGGPRLLALMGLSAASLLFGAQDRCWHLHTADDLRLRSGEGDILHAPAGDEVHTIPVPLLPMGRIFPHLQTAAYLTPQQIIDDRAQQASRQDAERCKKVYLALTRRQREVLRAFSQPNASVESVAQALHVGRPTLDTHKTRIFTECRIAWGLPMKMRLTHHFLQEKFGRLDPAFWHE